MLDDKSGEDAWSDRYDQEEEKIRALPFDEAWRQAELLLADPSKFECVLSPTSDEENLAILAPGLRSLFSRFESIYVVDDEASLNRQEIELFDWDGNGLSWGMPFWKIGTDGHTLILVKPNEELVYSLGEAEDELDDLGEPYPSIYHWLLLVSALASDFAP